MVNFKEFMLKFLEEQNKKRSYACLMLDIPNNVTQPFLNFIKDEDLHEYGKETDTHTTIKYGLHSDDHEPVLAFCEDYAELPFEITLKNFSLFENEEYDVLKLMVESKELVDLNKKVCKEFEHTDTFPTYNPHTTLAYLKKGKGKEYVKLLEEHYPDYENTLKVDKVVFSTSKGERFS